MRKSINEKYILLLSHLTRGAWIEMKSYDKNLWKYRSHLTRGAWIEIPSVITTLLSAECRTSHEVRGLKYLTVLKALIALWSHLTRGAWIEIKHIFYVCHFLLSHLTRGAWIEIILSAHTCG